MLKHIFSRNPKETAAFFAPKGECAYVIGDIHGCLDPLDRLLDKIERCATDVHPHLKTSLIFVGDLIDRGPKSAQVVERLSRYTHPKISTEFIMGNHEEVFLDVLSGNLDAMISWFEWGGREASRSYGVDNLGQFQISPKQVLTQLQQRVPEAHLEFLSSFKPYHLFGDYLIVHAGIRPKVALEDQDERELRWIRERFLNYKGQFPYKIIHGHTIVESAQNLPNRIAVDTGAYRDKGVLTAAFIAEDKVEFLAERTSL